MAFFKAVFNYSSPTNIQYHGLMNQGSTCYLNSVLQVLFMTKDFREAVKRYAEENPDTDRIDHDLKDLFMDLEKRTTYTYKMTKKLGIVKVYEQQDAAEYFEKILRLTSPEASQIFQGKLAHETTCCKCGTQTGTAEPFWHLPLALDFNRKDYSVEDGIKEFFKVSEFFGDNQMYCDNCDDKNNATSKYVIKNHPEVLMLLLKRFDFNYFSMKYIKINCVVDVPYSLQIPKGQTYELYAVVDHCGDLRSGHYNATIKDENGDRWYNFDDTRVTSPDNYKPFHMNNTEKSQSAYLLFYRKKKNADTQDSQEVSYSGDVQLTTNNNNDQGQDAEKIRDGDKSKDAPEDGNYKMEDDEEDMGGKAEDDDQEENRHGTYIETTSVKDHKKVVLEKNREKRFDVKTDESEEESEKSLVENLNRDQQQVNGELVSVRQNGNEHQDSKQKTGQHYDPVHDYMAKQRDEKMKTDILAPDSETYLTRYDLFKQDDHDDREAYMKENLSKDDQGSRSRMERKQRKREKERGVTGEKEKRRNDEHARGEKSTVKYEVVREQDKGSSSQSIIKDQVKTRQRMSVKCVGVKNEEDTEIIKYQLMKTKSHSGNDGRVGDTRQKETNDYLECKKDISDTLRDISLRHSEDKMGVNDSKRRDEHMQSRGSTMHCSVHGEDNGRSHEQQKQGVQYPNVSVKKQTKEEERKVDSHSRGDMRQELLSDCRGERIDQRRHHVQFKRLGDTGPDEKYVDTGIVIDVESKREKKRFLKLKLKKRIKKEKKQKEKEKKRQKKIYKWLRRLSCISKSQKSPNDREVY